jgi:hypothetical protein
MSSEWPLQRPGDQGHRVKVLQRLLVHRGVKIGTDGVCGPETEEGGESLPGRSEAGGRRHGGRSQVAGPSGRGRARQQGRGGHGRPELLVPRMVGTLELTVDGVFGPDTDKATPAGRSPPGGDRRAAGRLDGRRRSRIVRPDHLPSELGAKIRNRESALRNGGHAISFFGQSVIGSTGVGPVFDTELTASARYPSIRPIAARGRRMAF